MNDLLSVRLFKALAGAALVTVALSWLMHLMVNGTGLGVQKTTSLQTIDFVRLKKESELETRSRQKPPPPPPPKTPPPPPKLQVATPQQAQQSPTPFAMPNLGLAPGVGGGPFLGAIAAPTGGGGDGDVIPLVRIAPRYPRSALLDGIEGKVVIEFIVNPDGTVRNARVVSAQPSGVFEQAAVSAALKWKFKPKIVDGVAVDQRVTQSIDFNLSQDE